MIANGQHFTFFNAKGERRDDYVVQGVMRAISWTDTEDSPSTFINLRNERTGRDAVVTIFWLTQGELSGRMHWLPTEQVA
jgi:hypothetical protein